MTDDATFAVGFIGLGVMGSPMASNLLKAGFRVLVNDRDRAAAAPHEAAGGIWVQTAREMAERCEVIFSCLPGLTAIETVALGPHGVLAGIRSNHAYFEMSTNSLDLLKRLHLAFSGRGAHMLEAPISGGGPGARRGRLAIFVGGEKSIYERYEHVLRAMGDRPLHVGAVGAGLVAKLVHNAASQTMQAALAEVFVMGVKAGAEPLALWKAIRQGSIGRRRTFDGLADRFLPGRFEGADAALRIIQKDMAIVTELARDLGIPTPFSNMATADINEAVERGWGELDCRVVMRLPQERAGLQIAVNPDEIKKVLEEDPPAPTDTRYGTG
jgi:3-hydroxyisobutyrate dehydrogenase